MKQMKKPKFGKQSMNKRRHARFADEVNTGTEDVLENLSTVEYEYSFESLVIEEPVYLLSLLGNIYRAEAHEGVVDDNPEQKETQSKEENGGFAYIEHTGIEDVLEDLVFKEPTYVPPLLGNICHAEAHEEFVDENFEQKNIINLRAVCVGRNEEVSKSNEFISLKKKTEELMRNEREYKQKVSTGKVFWFAFLLGAVAALGVVVELYVL